MLFFKFSFVIILKTAIQRGVKKLYCLSRGQQFISVMAASAKDKLAAVPDVEIDDGGRFKYILIKLYVDDGGSEDIFKYIVRGSGKAAFHGRLIQQSCTVQKYNVYYPVYRKLLTLVQVIKDKLIITSIGMI